LLAWDGQSLHAVKVASTPPEFQNGVMDAIRSVLRDDQSADVIHGSTVATNALLERSTSSIAFITTAGFRDMLLIGRQNRPSLYALQPRRPAPIVTDEHTFTVTERIDATGKTLEPLDLDEVDRFVRQIHQLQVRHVAVCLLFSFINPVHEREIGQRCRDAGLTVTLSSELLPEFREYERASTTAINAALRPNVEQYLSCVSENLPRSVKSFSVMHSGGGTLPATDASRLAARLLLSGPAGGLLGAQFIARQEGIDRIITYDMGGTSTDAAAIAHGKPPWTTTSMIDGLPVGLPMFDIHTIGAGGGSIAWTDAGGALRVGPKSGGANPGPACYGRGGELPTVTDANLILGRILPGRFLGGRMELFREKAEHALVPLAVQMNKSLINAALGILRIAESNMASAIRHVTSRKGHDPRAFTLVSFGGAGGLHPAAMAEVLGVARVLVPPHAGLLSALGMIVAPPLVDSSRSVVHLGAALDDARLLAEFALLTENATRDLADDRTERVETFADCRFQGQSYELTVPVAKCSREAIDRAFRDAYSALYGRCPEERSTEIVTLRVRRIGEAVKVKFPRMESRAPSGSSTTLVLPDGHEVHAPVLERAELASISQQVGPALLCDPDSTTFVPPGWNARLTESGSVMLEQLKGAHA